MKDVARAAGVSPSSVSHAYTNSRKLSAQQRVRILKIAKQLGYAGPDPMARSLRTGHTDAWGLMINEQLTFAFNDPTTMMLLRGMSVVCDEQDIALNLLPVPGSALADAETCARKTGLVRNAHVDAFLAYFFPENSPVLEAALARNIPMVTIDSPAIEGVSHVGIDDYDAARTAASHLIEQGHRKIVILADRLHPSPHMGFVSDQRLRTATYPFTRNRTRGYLDRFREAGIDPQDTPVFEAGGYSAAQARSAASFMLDYCECTAIAALSDTLALAALDELASREIKVPEAMSVIGFDGIPASADAGLTTVRQPLVQKGRKAAEMLLRLQSGAKAEHVVMDTHLIVRRT